ncbi:MAG: phenylalanine--tRNA ligase subunit beta [Planctomycetota bacterium]|nr:phenylalanine--tRNA ligase subunit beta [Planctomycetota bacterium]
MRVSLSWIERLLERRLPVAPSELAELLSAHTAEIERVIRHAPRLQQVVVGRVVECRPHPDADRLRCTQVDVGEAVLPIVCGAPNVAAGQTVAVALPGASVLVRGRDGQQRALTIAATTIRGQPSAGMLCAEDELGLGETHDGILVLRDGPTPGTPLAEALGIGDPVLEVSSTAITHRPDLWGQLGWAREIAALCELPPPPAPCLAWHEEPAGWEARVLDAGCRSYCAAVVEGVRNGPSPPWMVELLAACGIRSLGLLVDITNFVMLELGEPMHAFDRRALAGRTLWARAAADGERLAALDGREHALRPSDLVIADERRALALAGIIGGRDSAVQDDTTAIVLEAAAFAPERVRRTRLRLGIATDSAARFEKSVQPEQCPAAIARALALLAELAPESRLVARFHAGPLGGEAREIAFDLAEVDARTGLRDGPQAARARLERLGFTVRGEGARVLVQVPWWRRRDVAIAADLVEEAGRLAGWQRIAPETPRLPAVAPRPDPLRRAARQLRAALSAQGWDEVCTYVFASPAWCEALAVPRQQLLALAHPPQPEWSFLRPCLLPGLLRVVAENRKHFPAVACYEIGKRYVAGEGASGDEETVACGVWAEAGQAAPFFPARDAALAALHALGYRPDFRPASAPASGVPGRCVELLVGEAVVGLASEVPLALRRLAGCPERVGWFRIDLERLLSRCPPPAPARWRPPSRFPPVEQDFTWSCEEALPYGRLAQAALAAAGELLVAGELVDIYRGPPYPPGRKAVTIRLVLQSEERTLTEQDIAAVRARVIAAVGALGAELAERGAR